MTNRFKLNQILSIWTSFRHIVIWDNSRYLHNYSKDVLKVTKTIRVYEITPT